MNTHRSNASVVAVLVILLVIAGVIYLFWQNQQATVVEEAAPAAEESVPAAEEPTAEAETSVEAEVEVSTESN